MEGKRRRKPKRSKAGQWQLTGANAAFDTGDASLPVDESASAGYKSPTAGPRRAGVRAGPRPGEPESVADESEEPAEPSLGRRRKAGEEAGPRLAEELAELPLEDLLALRDQLGTKRFAHKAFQKEAEEGGEVKRAGRGAGRERFVRENRKRPAEVSAKQPVSAFRNVFQDESLAERRQGGWDPRFSGEADAADRAAFRRNYAFVEDLQARELKAMRRELRQPDLHPQRKLQIKDALKRHKSLAGNRAEEEARKAALRALRSENEARAADGLKPVFKTRRQLKDTLQEDRFQRLKKTGKLEKYMKRKSKKEAGKRGRGPQAKDSNFTPLGDQE